MMRRNFYSFPSTLSLPFLLSLGILRSKVLEGMTRHYSQKLLNTQSTSQNKLTKELIYVVDDIGNLAIRSFIHLAPKVEEIWQRFFDTILLFKIITRNKTNSAQIHTYTLEFFLFRKNKEEDKLSPFDFSSFCSIIATG